jgi:hypothetical protein
MARLPEDVYRVAQAAAALGPDRLRTLSEALEMLERATEELSRVSGKTLEETDPEAMAAALRTISPTSRRALEAALALHRSVVEAALDIEARRFEELTTDPPTPDEEQD